MIKRTSGSELRRITPENLSMKNSKSFLFSRTQFLAYLLNVCYAGDFCSLVFLTSRLIASPLDRCVIPILSYSQTPIIRTLKGAWDVLAPGVPVRGPSILTSTSADLFHTSATLQA